MAFGFGRAGRFIAALALLLAGSTAFGQSALPPLAVGIEDAAKLSRGEAVIREVRDARALALTAKGATADRLRSRIAALKPNYLSEVIFELPQREGALDSLTSTLADVKSYMKIRYWSKRQKTSYDLFDRMDISERRATQGGEMIDVLEHMEPFADFACRYSYARLSPSSGAGDELFFECENTSPISLQGIAAVTSGHMLWMLYAFPSEGKIIFYGVGAVRAFDMFGAIRDRLKVSFLSRVEAFFGYMGTKMRG